MAMLLNVQLLNRLRGNKKKDSPSIEKPTQPSRKGTEAPELLQFIKNRDLTGAVSFLKYQRKTNHDPIMEEWLGYCLFNSGEYKEAAEVYVEMLNKGEFPEDVHVFLGCCLFFLGLFNEAKESAEKGAEDESGLRNRLLFHCAFKMQSDSDLLRYHSKLTTSTEDKMSLAALHYLRMHYNEALNICTEILNEFPNFIAVNFYAALCYFKLDYYDRAMESVIPYLKEFPDSPAAKNLRSSALFKLGNNSVHLEMSNSDTLYPHVRTLYLHNNVVFNRGTNALQVLPSLVDLLPEARLNLIIYHLSHDDIDNAFKLFSHFEAATPLEYLLKAITYLMIGQKKLSQFFYNDDTFCFNYGQALVMNGQYEEAVAVLSEVTNFSSLLYHQLLVKSYIMSGEAAKAWDLYDRISDSRHNHSLLNIIAHDSFVTKQFASMAKAYDALEKLDPSPENWLGKRAAVSGQFGLLVKSKCTGEEMAAVLAYLRNGTHSQIESITNTVRKWAKENEVTDADAMRFEA